MRRVLILSSRGRFPAPFDGEVWGLNRSYRMWREGSTPPHTRHFVMDHLWKVEREGGNEAYASDLAALGIPIIMQKHHPEIPLSEPNPTDQIAMDLGRDYFTSSISYMFTRAIWEGFDEIVLNKVLSGGAWNEYIQQKPCLDYWLGFAEGRRIKVYGSSSSLIGNPFPWQPKRYGYQKTDQRPVGILTAAVKEIMNARN